MRLLKVATPLTVVRLVVPLRVAPDVPVLEVMARATDVESSSTMLPMESLTATFIEVGNACVSFVPTG